MQKRFKAIGKFLSSMRFGILLLVVLTLTCVAGSLISQGHPMDWYLQRYPERTAALIYGLHLDDVFHSAWFLVLAVILCGNLLLCNLLHLPGLLRRFRDAADPLKAPKTARITAGVSASPEEVFEKLRMPKPKIVDAEGGERMFSVKNRIGLCGAWICHLGILLLIIGFTMGQVTTEEYTVYGVPGQTRPVGDTGYTVTIDDFKVQRSESDTVQQYTTLLTMRDGRTGAQQSASASVNHPAGLFGYRVYQNSVGPAAKVTVKRDGKTAQEEYVCVGEYVYVLNTPLMLYFVQYEDAYYDAGSGKTLPGYAYSTYYMGEPERAGVQVEGDTALTYGSVEISFSDPQDYTLLQVKADHFSWLVLLGGVILLAGLALAFFLPMTRVWAGQEADGSWTVSADSRNAGPLFAEQFREAAGIPEMPEETNGKAGKSDA